MFGRERFVHLLQRDADPKRHDSGITEDVVSGLEWHNHGPRARADPAEVLRSGVRYPDCENPSQL
jgi:hypothetical protein